MNIAGFVAINVANHYWIIGGSTTDVYSSATNTLVPVDDGTYAAWSAFNVASPIPDEAELADVLRSYGSRLPEWLFNAPSFIQPTPTTYTSEQLAAYAGEVRWQAEVTGVSGGTSYRTDRLSRALLNTTLAYVRANTSATVEWKALDGTFHTLDATEMETFNNDVNVHVESCYASEKTCKVDIDAGTVTTLAQIDAVFEPLRKLPWSENYRKGL